MAIPFIYHFSTVISTIQLSPCVLENHFFYTKLQFRLQNILLRFSTFLRNTHKHTEPNSISRNLKYDSISHIFLCENKSDTLRTVTEQLIFFLNLQKQMIQATTYLLSSYSLR